MSVSLGLVRYGSEPIRYEVLSSPRRKTLGIEVHPDLRVLVRAPAGCDAHVIEARVRRRAKWISRQLAYFGLFSPRTPPRRYVSGETHLYLGRQYRLKVVNSESEHVKLTGGSLVVSSPSGLRSGRVRELLQDWYRNRARDIFSSILEHCFDYFRRQGSSYPKLAIRCMERRWGSLSTHGTMTLNLNLVRAPKRCIEYVVTHELGHLVYPHHGTAFQRLLNRLMPDWERRKQILEQALL